MSTEAQGDSSAPSTIPPSELETEPASPTFASTNITRPPTHEATAPVRATKVPTRRYGKQKVVEEVRDEQEEAVKTNRRSLEKDSTVIIPETDPDIDMGMVGMDTNGMNSSSQPDSSEPRSTSPTSTEGEDATGGPSREEEEREACKGQDVEDLLGNLSDDSSDGRKAGGAEAFFRRNRPIKEALADIDNQSEEDELNSPARSSKPVTEQAPPTSSSLPTLTESDPASHDNLSSQPTPSVRQQSSTRRLSPADEDESQQPHVPTARSRTKKSRAIVDSEDEEDDNDEANRTINAPPRSESSDQEGALGRSSPVPAAPSAPAPSKQERLQALVSKKKAAMTPVVSPPRKVRSDESDAIENTSGEEESKSIFAKKKSKTGAGKRKVKGLSKKAEEEMNKTTESFKREQQLHVEAYTKNKLNVKDALKNPRSSHRDSTAPLLHRTAPSRENISSSDPIQASSPPPRPSAKALGKQRQLSPIVLSDNDATPQCKKKIVIDNHAKEWAKKKKAASSAVKASDDEDTDEDLVSLDNLLVRNEEEKREKERQDKEKLEKKRAMRVRLKEVKTKAAQDSDSDLDIQGGPPPRPRARPMASRQTSSPKVSTRPGSQIRHVLKDVAHADISHHDQPTESQFKRSGKEFGRNLDDSHHYGPSPSTSNPARNPKITQNALNEMLKDKSRRQALDTRVKKMESSRNQRTAESNEQAADGPAPIDVKSMMEKKKRQQEEQKEEDEVLEEQEDSDFRPDADEEEEEADEMGSGSDVPRDAEEGDAGPDLEEGEFDSDGDLKMPASSQNSDRLGQGNLAADSQDEDEEDELPTTRKPAVKPRVVDDEDEEEEEEEQKTTSSKSKLPTPLATEIVPSADAGPAAVRMNLDVFGGGGADDDGGGFSQFFNSDFSQAVGGDNDMEGFARPAELSPVAPSMFVAEPLISTAERAADAALLEARGAIHNIEPGTPREAAVPRQYINKQGFMTQTRPVGMFADSPLFSPRDSQPFQDSLSTAQDSQSQGLDYTQSQTQINGTPTQALRHPNQLRRQAPLVRLNSLLSSEAQPDPTEVVPEEEDEEESLPSAAQQPQPRDAFAIMKKGAAMLEAIPEQQSSKSRRPAKSAFIENEAGLDSDEEGRGGLNALSDDENEEGHDAELEDLVDNEVVDEEERAKQDALAEELRKQQEAQADAAGMKKAQNIVTGKERQKRKGLHNFDDEDDFDDDYQKREHREKKQRIEGLVMEGLLQNEETKPFAKALQSNVDSASAPFLETLPSDDERLQEDEEDHYEDPQPSQDFFTGGTVKTKTTHNDLRAEAIKRQREVDEAQMNADEFESQLEMRLKDSSSPVASYKTNNRIQQATSRTVQPRKDDLESLESQYSLGPQESSHNLRNLYKSTDSREESQGSGNGISAGASSAITSFHVGSKGKSALAKSNSTSNSTSSKLRKNGSALGLKSKSTFSSIRSKDSFGS